MLPAPAAEGDGKKRSNVLLNNQDLLVIVSDKRKFSISIDENFVGPVKYSFNCNGAMQ